MNRDPQVLINGTYYLSIVTAVILVIIFILSFLNVPQFCLSIIIISFVGCGLGLMMAFMARNETKSVRLDKEGQTRLKVGLRFNAIFLGLHILLFIIIVGVTLAGG